MGLALDDELYAVLIFFAFARNQTTLPGKMSQEPIGRIGREREKFIRPIGPSESQRIVYAACVLSGAGGVDGV
jgi:hypothetical protein